MNKIIDGKLVSQKIKDTLKTEVTTLKVNKKRIPKLVVLLIGDNPASMTYVKNKEKACSYIGIESEIIKKKNSTTEELLEIISNLNEDKSVDGILVQLPLPKNIDENKVLNSIYPEKDVDGFHPINIAKLFLGETGFLPCTPSGIIELLNSISYDLTGKEVVVIGRSNIVGKPMSLLCLQKNATVTIAHSKTKSLKEICKRADVLISAIGKANFITDEFVKENAVVIDVGINRNSEDKLCGDVDFTKVYDKVSAITPVPGGVGPMTIAMLMKNTLTSYKRREKENL